MYSPELNHLFTCWLLYRSLAGYWHRSYQEYLANKGKEWLKNSQQAGIEAEDKAEEYGRLFVAAVSDCGRPVSYKPNVGVMVG